MVSFDFKCILCTRFVKVQFESEHRAKKGKYIETRRREKVTKLGNSNGQNI